MLINRFIQIHILTLATLTLSLSVSALEKVIHIYQDADISNHEASSHAIQRGIELAFDEIGNEIQGYKVAFKYLDHRGNVVRSKRNYTTFINDPNALAIYSGIHSPPLIKNRAFINEIQALTLVPWAAGGPITRYPSAENWIFRLSIDDTQAGSVIVDFAMKDQKCKRPHLLLENTAWGESNYRSMSEALRRYNISAPSVTRFSWNVKAQGARTILRDIIHKGRDCIVLVANAVEGAIIVGELVRFPEKERLPIISHWGITGGDFHNKVPAEHREKLRLHFIQSCFAFTNPKQNAFAQEVFNRLRTFSKGLIDKPADLKAAVGFIHAYDLTKLLISAIKHIELTGNIIRDRDQVRLALENLNVPVQGLVKTYQRPFSTFDQTNNKNAHEALHKEHYCMGRFGSEGDVLISE